MSTLVVVGAAAFAGVRADRGSLRPVVEDGPAACMRVTPCAASGSCR
jgi:hypothetical protein